VPRVRAAHAPDNVRALTVRFRACWALVAVVVIAAPAQASWRRYRVADPGATLARLNALRASFGARPLSVVRAWSDGCARHIAYTRHNPFGHAEQPGRPGYTRAGALAGRTSVLVSPPEEPFATRLGAWADEPYHQAQVLNPRLARTGFSLGCLNTARGLVSPPQASGPPRLLAWPGDGSAGVPRSIDACDEIPRDPFTDMGWGCDRTGAALYVFAPAARCTAAPVVRLTPAVPLAVVGAGSCSWIVLTARPLPAGRVRMDVTLAGRKLRQAFSTAGAPRAPCCPAAAAPAARTAARPARWPAA
jgi:hypothetical protein